MRSISWVTVPTPSLTLTIEYFLYLFCVHSMMTICVFFLYMTREMNGISR